MQDTTGIVTVSQETASRVDWRQFPDGVRRPVISTLEQEPKS